MKHIIPLFSILLFTFNLTAQDWTWEALKPMPESVSNNAVTAATINGIPYVYSFAGIDSTKIWSGIHLKGFRYNTATDTWQSIPPLPDVLGKVAAGANTVKNKIYIIGGYNVFPNGNEVSSAKTHIFDPETNSYLPDGAPIPIAIDDHVQAVWRDSLIFVVTGWSDNQNVTNVQVYNPSTDSWSVGTPVPNNTNYRVFGASGMIIGDTIYYGGGARYASNFPPTNYIRKGYIDPSNPTNITWSNTSMPLSRGYRMAAIELGGKGHWIGGSYQTYNYNGIAYNGSGGVPALDRVVTYSPSTGVLTEEVGSIPAVMDLRGIAQISLDESIIAGGMMGNQEVTNAVFKLKRTVTSTQSVRRIDDFVLFPNPAADYFQIQDISAGVAYIFNSLGQLVQTNHFKENEPISIKNLTAGIYQILVKDGKQLLKSRLIVK